MPLHRLNYLLMMMVRFVMKPERLRGCGVVVDGYHLDHILSMAMVTRPST